MVADWTRTDSQLADVGLMVFLRPEPKMCPDRQAWNAAASHVIDHFARNRGETKFGQPKDSDRRESA